MQRHMWLSAARVAGSSNVDADLESRVFNDRTEWMLQKRRFKDITNVFGVQDVDLFASRLNAQLWTFVSWRPDPEASQVDAFTITWTDKLFYLFPPFSLEGTLSAETGGRWRQSDHGDTTVADPAMVFQAPGDVDSTSCTTSSSTHAAVAARNGQSSLPIQFVAGSLQVISESITHQGVSGKVAQLILVS